MKKLDFNLQITKLLLENPYFITVSDISLKLNVSTKTIYNYLENYSFKKYIFPCSLEKKQRQGIRLLGNIEQIEQLRKKIVFYEQEQNQFTHILDSDDDSFILNTLFNSTKKFTTQYFANKLYSSQNNITTKLKNINDWLYGYGVKLSRKNNLGCTLEGNEENIRIAYKDYIMRKNLHNNNLHISSIDRLSDTHYKKLIILFDKQEVDKIIQILSLAEIVLNNKFTEGDFYRLIVQLLVMIIRIKLNKFVNYKSKNFKNIPEFLAAQIIKTHIEDILKFKIIEDELYLMTEYLLSARKQKEDINFNTKNKSLNDEIFSKFIQHISECLKIDLSQDQTFKNNLILHLIPAVKRSKFGVTAENPLLNKIRYEYTDIYLAVLTSIEELETTEQIYFDANEIGYICLHVAAAINRCKKNGYIRTCLICDSGITITNYLESVILKYLPEIKISKSCVSSEFYLLNKADFDLILDSTHLLKSDDGKLIQISELLKNDEITYIQNWILSKYLLDFHDKSPSIKGKIMYFHDDLPNRDSVLYKYGQYLFLHGYVKKNYDRSLIEREERVSTAMGRYVAVPHGSKDLVLRPSLIIVNLKNPILWDSEFRVDLIFILAVNFAKVQINKYLFSKLYEIIKDEKLISAIKNLMISVKLKNYFLKITNNEVLNYGYNRIVN